MNLVPVPNEPERATCANCSAPLAPDQRYCLACGQPVTPVRLAFLDVLQADAQPYGAGQGAAGSVPAGYAPVIEPSHGAEGWMRRYSGLFGLLSVLLMAIIAGLLVGHWITQNKAPTAPQVVKVEGLSAAAAPAASAPSTSATTPASSTPTGSQAKSSGSSKGAALPKTSAKTEASEAKEATAIEKAPAPKAKKINSTKLKKLGATSGKKHEEEINSLGAQPIETGGG